MYARAIETDVRKALKRSPAVALLGPRQVGKTTLALAIASEAPGAVYLDLESPSDRARLSEPEAWLDAHRGRLVVFDEVHRAPDLFAVLRGVIDRGRRSPDDAGRFLLLGSASLELLRQGSETLAGRIAFVELAPLRAAEVGVTSPSEVDRLWLRGGFPASYLADSDADSLAWRVDFVRTYLERDVPQFGPRVPAETLRRFWTMLAHEQGGLLNAARLAASLGVSGQTVARYLDLLVDLLLVRRVQPCLVNVGKRLVRAPKVYVRDSGIVHALLGLTSVDDVLGHPVAGGSYEGYALEEIADASGVMPMFYRTAAGAEIDVVLDLPANERWVIEIKRSRAPVLSRGFHIGATDLKATRRVVVHSGEEAFPMAGGVEALPLAALVTELRRRRRI